MNYILKMYKEVLGEKNIVIYSLNQMYYYLQ